MTRMKYPLSQIDVKNVDEDEPARSQTDPSRIQGRRNKVITINLDEDASCGLNSSDTTTPETSPKFRRKKFSATPDSEQLHNFTENKRTSFV